MFRVNFAEVSLKYHFYKEFGKKSWPNAKLLVEDTIDNFYFNKHNAEKYFILVLDLKNGLKHGNYLALFNKFPSEVQNDIKSKYLEYIQNKKNYPYLLIDLYPEDTLNYFKALSIIFVDFENIVESDIKSTILHSFIDGASRCLAIKGDTQIKMMLDVSSIFDKLTVAYNNTDLKNIKSSVEREVFAQILLSTELLNQMYCHPPIVEITNFIPKEKYKNAEEIIHILTSKYGLLKLSKPSNDALIDYLFRIEFSEDISELISYVRTVTNNFKDIVAKDRNTFYKFFLDPFTEDGVPSPEVAKVFNELYSISEHPEKSWFADNQEIYFKYIQFSQLKRQVKKKKIELKRWLGEAGKGDLSMKDKIKETKKKAFSSINVDCYFNHRLKLMDKFVHKKSK
jgi:hypothetical protein